MADPLASYLRSERKRFGRAMQSRDSCEPGTPCVTLQGRGRANTAEILPRHSPPAAATISLQSGEVSAVEYWAVDFTPNRTRRSLRVGRSAPPPSL